MTAPYAARICAALPGDAPIELARFSRRINPSDWRSWTVDLGRDWETWIEEPLRDRDCITARPKITHYTGDRGRLYLSAEEKREAGVRCTL